MTAIQPKKTNIKNEDYTKLKQIITQENNSNSQVKGQGPKPKINKEANDLLDSIKRDMLKLNVREKEEAIRTIKKNVNGNSNEEICPELDYIDGSYGDGYRDSGPDNPYTDFKYHDHL